MASGTKKYILECFLSYNYIELGLSSTDIAKKINCSHVTILKYLNKYNIKIRNSSESHKMPIYKNKLLPYLVNNKFYLGHKHTQEWKNKQSAYFKGHTLTIETKNKISKALTGRKLNVEFCEKEKIAQLKRYQNPEEKLKTSLAMKKYYENNPDARIKQSNQLKSLKNNPEIKSKMYSSIRKSWECPIRKAKRSKMSKDLWENPNFRQKRKESVEKWWKTNPNASIRRKNMLKGLLIRPTKPELILKNILDKYYPNEWNYTGDGSFIIGKLNPDFIHKNNKYIIEVFGDYWHSDIVTKNYYMGTEKGRILYFNRYQYKTLILWENEINKVTKQEIADKINNFFQLLNTTGDLDFSMQKSKHQL